MNKDLSMPSDKAPAMSGGSNVNSAFRGGLGDSAPSEDTAGYTGKTPVVPNGTSWKNPAQSGTKVRPDPAGAGNDPTPTKKGI